MLNTTIKRPAIAMIELIFAIVIMGIVMMSAPMLINTAAKSGYITIQQEAINEAASQVNMIMGYHWDEASSDETFLDPILSVTHGDDDLNVSSITGRRIGTPLVSYRTSIRSDGTKQIATAVPVAGNIIKNDIADFNGIPIHLVLIPESTLVADNIETTTIDINTSITYGTDGADYNLSDITYNPFNVATTPTTNIKLITVTLTSSSGVEELDKEIILRAFSCNIGGYKLEEKDF